MAEEKILKEMQEAIDRSYELAKRDVKESKEKYGIEKDLERSFCFFVCWDLQRQFGLDLKGVVPE